MKKIFWCLLDQAVPIRQKQIQVLTSCFYRSYIEIWAWRLCHPKLHPCSKREKNINPDKIKPQKNFEEEKCWNVRSKKVFSSIPEAESVRSQKIIWAQGRKDCRKQINSLHQCSLKRRAAKLLQRVCSLQGWVRNWLQQQGQWQRFYNRLMKWIVRNHQK